VIRVPGPRPGLRTALIRRGSRRVLMTYPGLRIGNYLYFALHAFLAQRNGQDYRVLDTGLGEVWYERFPKLEGLMVDRVRAHDRREFIPPLFHQNYGADFDDTDLTSFTKSVLEISTGQQFEPTSITVNVRRGDYYESPQRRHEFAFDVVHYLNAAIGRAQAHHPVSSVKLISDDPAWAAAAFADARPDMKCTEIVPGPPDHQLLALARSPRLILANSTFSYWGAYLSAVASSPEPTEVYVPDMHDRTVMGGRAWQHAPSWTAIETHETPSQGQIRRGK
jgi:hypothetical protein